MTAFKLFAIAANGTPMGIYRGVDADEAVNAYGKDAGYISSEHTPIVTDWRSELDVEDLTTGSVVAFSNASDATWYDLIRTEGDFGIVVREVDTDYAEQTIDCSMITQIQIKAA